MRRGIFVTGTDTDIGKTFVACGIAASLYNQGIKVGVYKPAASGCRRDGGEIIAEDAELLWQAAGKPKTLEAVCPQRFLAPLAPHLAAKQEGRELDFQKMISGLEAWSDSEFVIVEGAGGLMSPVGDEVYIADLAIELGFPLVIVAPNRIGTINQTLLTLMAADSYKTGLSVDGIVLNTLDDATDDPSRSSNRSELSKHSNSPILAEIPHHGGPNSFAWAKDVFYAFNP